MVTRLYTHADCATHETPAGHPEQIARMGAIEQGLLGLTDLERKDAPLGTDAHLLLCHPQQYIDRIRGAVPASGMAQLDGDTWLSAGSLNAALRGVGAIVDAVDAVLSEQVTNAFCATRPPGHHAETETPMGFCLFGHAAIGARYALEQHGLSRVAVIDFDVHHGNGTQDLLQHEPRAFFTSSHQMPLWPGSGYANETGPHGNIMNVPLAPNSTGQDLLDIYEREVFPRLREHAPELMIISAGFDAHIADPLANLAFTTEEFGEITAELVALANELCDGRIVSTLEGGYDLDALAQSAYAHVRALMEA